MKQGWEIKKLGEVCEIQGGSTPKRTESLYWDGGTYPWFTIEDIREQGRIITDTKQKVTKVAWDKLRVFPKDTVLLCCTASIGEYAITHIPLTSNQQFNGLMIKDKSYLNPMYLMHYCATLKDKLAMLSGKATIDFVPAEKVRQITIPIPPIEEQERIVAELDCLSGIIERKREQLRELDALAQSIFYQMFGDPITNEKGWEAEELQKVSTLLNGRAYKQNELLDSGRYKVLRVGNFFTNSNYYYSDLELEDDKYCDNGDLLFAWSASFGAFIWNGGKVIYHYHIWKVLYDKQKLNIDYYRFLLNTMTAYFMKDVHGIGMVHLTKAGMEQYVLPIPPLALQQEFADKIEAIEKQKELIKKSISETENLFNARMDYYFN
ncbi:MAG: restriction endonuclease subunit S [Lachnospiraceae bacterium]|nr:restriction endonuclease subunit S [Lachnospiraceae bacterium]